MPSKQICTFEDCTQTQNTSGLCGKHWHRAKSSPDGKPYRIDGKCIVCSTKYDSNKLFCDDCMIRLSKDERKKLYKAHHYRTKTQTYINAKNNNPVSPEKSKLYNLKYNYGISEEEYQTLVEITGPLCTICKRNPVDVNRKNKWLVLDHNHTTGLARGLLCHSCNVALGLFQDDTSVLLSAIDYLNLPKKWWINDGTTNDIQGDSI